MVECKEEALVKEERRTEVILAVVPPPIFLWRQTAASLFYLLPSRDRDPNPFYRRF
jgi:hypothetical protein